MSVYKRGEIWHYDFAIKGARFRGSTHATDKASAQKIYAKLRLEAAESVHFRKSREMSLAEAFLRYRDHGDRLPSGYTIAVHIDKLRGMGDTLSLTSVDDALVSDYVAKRRGEKARHKDQLVSNATINRELTTLRAVMRRAADQWGVSVGSIKWRKHLLPEEVERRRYLTAEEEQRLIAALRPGLRELVRFCLLTGARFSSAISLCWSDVDRGAGVITFRTMKGGGSHVVPLTMDVLDILKQVRGQHPVFVFTYECLEDRPLGIRGAHRKKGQRYPFSSTGWRRPWANALDTAGITDFRFHDLRHTALSRITRVAGIAVAQSLAGHADITTTRRYAHVLLDDVKAAMEKAARHTDATATQPKTQKPRKGKVL